MSGNVCNGPGDELGQTLYFVVYSYAGTKTHTVFCCILYCVFSQFSNSPDLRYTSCIQVKSSFRPFVYTWNPKGPLSGHCVLFSWFLSPNLVQINFSIQGIEPFVCL